MIFSPIVILLVFLSFTIWYCVVLCFPILLYFHVICWFYFNSFFILFAIFFCWAQGPFKLISRPKLVQQLLLQAQSVKAQSHGIRPSSAACMPTANGRPAPPKVGQACKAPPLVCLFFQQQTSSVGLSNSSFHVHPTCLGPDSNMQLLLLLPYLTPSL